MRRSCFCYITWLLVIFCVLLNDCIGESQITTWSKAEASISNQNNDWIPVQGKCLTCRPNRDLDAQSTNEQINRILSPPLPTDSQNLPSSAAQPIQFVNSKQPRILPFGSNFIQYNNDFPPNNNNKQYQMQTIKLFPQEQKQFFQYENVPSFVKQPFSVSSQQLVQQSAGHSQQHFTPANEPYPFTLPLKTIDATTPKITYQPKIRFPDSDIPKLISNSKITSQNNDEIQLLYVPVETLQRGRKNMKDISNQNPYPQMLPHGFVSPQYNLQYSSIPKIPEKQFFFSPNFSPATNFVQLNPLVQPKVPSLPLPPPPPAAAAAESIYANISKNFLQPYFTINGLYTTISQVQPAPTKLPQSDLQFYNIVQTGLASPTQAKVPEQQFKISQTNPPHRYSNKFEFNNFASQGEYLLSNNANNPNDVKNIRNQVVGFVDTYSPITSGTASNTQYETEKTTYQNGRGPGNKYNDFQYEYVTVNPQTSASQNQQYFVGEQGVVTPPKTDLNQKTAAASTTVRFMQTSVSPQSGQYDDLTRYPVPHQPPLSFYMEKLHNSKINDVLYLLKDAKTIPVLDTVENEPPQVFVGPSELQPPKGYIKFELPYLSSLDYSRIEKMIDKLPFFVAPLNFKPPPGYSKIPFPAPHIGSVVLSNSSTIQESFHNKPYEHKYRPSTQLSSTLVELSTNAPQLTSQINSLFDVPSSVSIEPISYKNLVSISPLTNVEQNTYTQFTTQINENVTKKPTVKNPFKTIQTTEQSKRMTNRQRKPIYRGYPTTLEITTRPLTTLTPMTTTTPIRTITTTDSISKYQSESTKNSESYAEFTAEREPSFNNDSDKRLTSNSIAIENTSYPYQLSNESNKSDLDYSNYFANFGKQNSYNQDLRFQNENTFNAAKQTSIQNGEYYSGNSHNYPYYTPQTPNEIKEENIAEQNNETETKTASELNVNFSNVKSLSQYDPFSKNGETSANITESTVAGDVTNHQNLNDFQFWNQNQFYNVNPSTIDYFSSTVGFQSDESSSTADIVKSKIPTMTYATFVPESSYTSTDIQKVEQNNEYSSAESTEKTITSPYRARIKQRIPSNRYHQSKFTTEKENSEYQIRKTGLDKGNSKNLSSVENNFETSMNPDMVTQSTEYQDFSTKENFKPHRRRNRPSGTSSVSSVTEVSSSTSRSYRTRATRFPIASTEKYHFRRPTTSVTTTTTESINSEWNGSVNNFVPSAPAVNEIIIPIDNKLRTNIAEENNNYHKSDDINHFWNDILSGHHAQTLETNLTTQAIRKNISQESNTETSQRADLSKSNSLPDEYSRYPSTGQSQQYLIEESSEKTENKKERIGDRKDESNEFDSKNLFNGSSKINNFEETTKTFNSENYRESFDTDSTFQIEKNFDHEVKKDKFIKDGIDNQKKAYDPQDEKKVSIKRNVYLENNFSIL